MSPKLFSINHEQLKCISKASDLSNLFVSHLVGQNMDFWDRSPYYTTYVFPECVLLKKSDLVALNQMVFQTKT